MNTLSKLSSSLGQLLMQRNFKLVTAESCTGGGIASCITDIAGSSAWFERGFVTYSNESKVELLGVPKAIIETHGAVSEQTALAMAKGALAHSYADIAVSVTGVAGPGGGTEDKPVGTVWFGFAKSGESKAVLQSFQGDRASIRYSAKEFALRELHSWASI